MSAGRLLLTTVLFLLGCSNGTPQVDFLQVLAGDALYPGINLKINGSPTAIGNNATPNIVVSGFSDSVKVEVFTTDTCDSSSKVGEVVTTASDVTTTLTPTALSADGVYTYYAKVTSTLGITSDCSKNKVTYTYDNTPPTDPTNVTLVTTAHNTATPAVQVTGVEVGANVSLYGDAACTVPAGASNGTASSTIINITSNTVTEGTHKYYAKVIDAAGNSSNCSSSFATYIYDVTPPAVPTNIALATGTASPSANTTPSFDVSGLVVGDTVKLFSDSLCLTEIASMGVTLTTTTVSVSPALTVDGTYQVYAEAIDTYGNASACSTATQTYILDKTPPVKPSALALKTPATSPGNSPTPVITVSGVVIADTVKLFTDAACTAQVASGNVTTGTSVDLSVNTLSAEGSYDFYANSTDPVGNVSTCSTAKVTYVYDFTPPNTPNSVTLVSPATSPSNVALPSFSIGANLAAGDIVKLYSDSNCATAASAAMTIPAGGGSVTVALATALTTSGNYTYYAKAYDSAGNASSCSSSFANYVFDNIAPTTPNSVTLTNPSTSPGNITSPTITVSGTTAGDTITIYKDAACTTVVTNITATAGTSTLVSIPTLSEGSYSFYAKAKDPAGNISGCTTSSANYVLDTTPPAAPSSLTLITPGSSPGKIATPTFQINGVVSGDTVGLYGDAVCTSLVTSGVATGTSILLTSGTITGAGTYNYYAASTDPAGNKSGCSSAIAYTYDNISPTVTSVSSSNADGTFGPGSVINLTLNMSEVVNVNTTGGTPTLMLNTSPTSRTASYVSGSGTAQLQFTYTVQLGDSSSDLDYASTTALTLNGALVMDLAGNNIAPTLSAPGSTNSLAYSRAIVISPNPPAVSILGSPTVRVNEGAGTQTFQLSLTFAAPYNMDVHLNSYGNALTGVDYMLPLSTITIPAGQTAASFTFTPLDNGTVDIPRRLLLTVDSINGNYYGMLNKFTQKEIFLIDNDQALTTVTVLSRGGSNNHQCAIKSNSAAYCWGANSSGQVGVNTSGTNEATPLMVSSFTSQATAIVTGGNHTCALKNDGSLWCWGAGSSGQLGIGSTTTKVIPYQVGTSSYKKIAAGSAHTCAIKSDDTLWCWGSNTSRQLGDGTANTTQINPVQVSGSDLYADVQAGGNHTCGLTTLGQLKCWGSNTNGESSGDGTTGTYVATPTNAAGSYIFSKISVGSSHTCGIENSTGALYCWGLNTTGQLGDGTNATKTTPVMIIGSGVSEIAAGNMHTCAVLASGILQCWGTSNFNQIGLGTVNSYLTPTTVLSNASTVTVGANHTCTILTDGSIKCWGQNTYNQLGYGREDAVKSMTIMEAGMMNIAVSENHGCGLTTSGGVRCWGTNSFGQVGDGTQNTRTSPVMIIPSGVAQVAVGPYGSCAVFTSGKLQCWGYNTNGRLGDGSTTSRYRPTDIIASGVAQVSMGIDSTCALMTDTSVKCWGGNGTFGKVGNGSTANQLTPVQVIASGATQVAVGSSHACALVGTAMYCWGDNTYGQYGAVLGTSSTTPMNTLNSFNYISAGTNYMCGTNSGDLFCWGQNSYGQIGDGTTTTRGVPTQIDLGVAYSQVYTGVYHTCGVTTAGALKCWGANSSYQMGATSSLTPIVVMGSNVVKASAGTYGTCAVESTLNGAYCTGTNSSGVLGLGNLSTLGLPLDVYGL